MGLHTKYNIVDRRHRLGRNLAVGDLIIARHPSFPTTTNIGKRVVGLPGDFVVRDRSYVGSVGGWDGRERERQGDGEGEAEPEAGQEPEMVEVPPGHIWVAGDNLSWSRDSRFFGPLPMGLVMGKIVAYSHPSSDWIVDMVWSRKDQLRDAQPEDGDEFSMDGGKAVVKMKDRSN